MVVRTAAVLLSRVRTPLRVHQSCPVAGRYRHCEQGMDHRGLKSADYGLPVHAAIAEDDLSLTWVKRQTLGHPPSMWRVLVFALTPLLSLMVYLKTFTYLRLESVQPLLTGKTSFLSRMPFERYTNICEWYMNGKLSIGGKGELWEKVLQLHHRL